MGYWINARKQPRILAFGSVGTIFVATPNESIFKGTIKLEVDVIDVFRHYVGRCRR